MLQELVALRHFVGTNVIATTKIVKKHDKNVPAALRSEARIYAKINDQAFFKNAGSRCAPVDEDCIPPCCTSACRCG